MSVIEDKGISFINKKSDGEIYKYGTSKVGDIDIEFLNHHKSPDVLLEIILDIEKALNGRFNDITDPDISNNINIVFIGEKNIEYYDEDGQIIIATSPLPDFKEKIIAWRKFLMTSPYHGSKYGIFRLF